MRASLASPALQRSDTGAGSKQLFSAYVAVYFRIVARGKPSRFLIGIASVIRAVPNPVRVSSPGPPCPRRVGALQDTPSFQIFNEDALKCASLVGRKLG